MRKDMQRVIIETKKRSGTDRKVRHKDLEDAPTKESMKARWKDRKYQGDRLNPLERFLQKNVGRKWDYVWAEICEFNDSRSPIGVHVRNHTWDYVDRIDMRNLYGSGRYGWGWGFFIDDAGYLRKYPRRKWPKRKKKFEPEKGVTFCQKYRGIWYFAVLEDYSYRYFSGGLYYTYTNQRIRRLKQLNKRELADRGFVNKPV